MKKLFVLVCLFLSFSCSKVVDEADVDNPGAESSSQDQRACEYAKNTKNVEVWRFYLKEFPNGLCNSEAKDAIINNYFEKKLKAEAEAKAREEQLYKEAREKNTLDAWENYSREFPEEERTFEAKFKIEEMRNAGNINPVNLKLAVDPKPEVGQQPKPEYVRKADSQNETSLKDKGKEIDNIKVVNGNADKASKELEFEKKNTEEKDKRLAQGKSQDAQEANNGKKLQIETLEKENEELQKYLATANGKIEELEKENDNLKENLIALLLMFGFLLGCVALVFVYIKFNPTKYKNYRSADEENEEPNRNSSDVIAEKVSSRLAQTLGRITMIVNSLPKQVSEQVVTQLMPIIRQQIEKSNIANATTHHTEAVSIPAEPVIKTYYARMVGERFESSGERSAWFILKDDGNTITFDLVDSCKKDRRTMNEAFKVLSQCFENYDSSDSNAVLITSPGKARRDDEEHWRVIEKGRILK